MPDHPNFLMHRFSGPTVHFVDDEYDTGPILAQRVVPVLPTDSPKRLAARVLKEVRRRRGVKQQQPRALCSSRVLEPVLPTDSPKRLAARVLKEVRKGGRLTQEHTVYPEFVPVLGRGCV